METSRRGFMGFLGGVMGAIGLGVKAEANPIAAKIPAVCGSSIVNLRYDLSKIPVWVDEETLMRESGGAYGESILKEKK